MMITDEDYKKYIGIHMPNVRKLTLEHTEKTVNELGQVSMSCKSYEVFGLKITSDPKGCKIDVHCVEEFTIDAYFVVESAGELCSYTRTFVLPTNEFDKWNQTIDNNNVGDQRCSVVLIEKCRAEHCETQSGLIKHHETVYRSTKLILNT